MVSNIRKILVIHILVMCLSFRDFRHLDIRKTFLDRIKQNKLSQGRERALDNYGLSNKEYLNGVVHYKISNSKKYTKWKRIQEIENDFRRLLAMKGVTYNYKRDVSWRTWRSVLQPNGKENIICYSCNSEAKNCKTCTGGVWTIEEKPPPCPYEFYSLVNDSVLCGANYTQYKDVKRSCPSHIKFSDLTSTCDNPIETAWRFSRIFNHSKKYENAICNGQDYCEIITIYTISHEHVTFRIINSSNIVIYSRIMKPRNVNYKCVEDCGIYHPLTKTVTKSENPLKLNLLTPSVKTKRENRNNLEFEPMTIENEMSNDRNLPASVGKNGMNKIKKHAVDNDLVLHEYEKISTDTPCKQIQKLSKNFEYEDNYYWLSPST